MYRSVRRYDRPAAKKRHVREDVRNLTDIPRDSSVSFAPPLEFFDPIRFERRGALVKGSSKH